MNEKKILITSALPYVNNVPHLGNIIGCVLSADVFARFSRLMGRETLFICGADEHGTATETKAKEEGVTPKELCDKYYKIHKQVYDWFSISFDIFGRTSTENHKKITQEMFNKVLANGYIQEDTVTQLFCTTCNTFLADRFVEGTCPYCSYEDARGDQCDSCGKLLNPSELINPRCKVDDSTPEFRDTQHLFLSLDKLQPLLENWVDKQSKIGAWSENSIRTTTAWFKEGLRKRAITRDLKWGINIPESAFNGRFKDKVFYVWFDAPIGYISITNQLLGEEYKKWWMDKENVKLYQFMGKDNIPFHSIIFPGTLLAAGNNHTLVHHIAATEYLNYEHGKFSKSRGTGVFGDNVQESGIPSDVYRYVLLFNRPENSDTQFTWDGLQERVNNELLANYGNFVNRSLTFTKRFFEGKLGFVDMTDLDDVAKSFVVNFKKEVGVFVQLLDQVKLRDALTQFMKLSSLGNQFFQERAPWKSRTKNPVQCEQDLFVLVNIVKDLAILSEPYIPQVSREVFAQLNCTEEFSINNVGSFSLKNHIIGEPHVLFQKIEDDLVVELKVKYAGKQLKDISATSKNIKKTIKSIDEKKDGKKMVDIKDYQFVVGKMLEVTQHENADKLYVEQVDIGENKPRQIVSGLAPYYKPEELVGKHIIVIKNLKPAKLRGVLSSGMLLAVESDDGKLGLITAPNSEPGSVVFTGDSQEKNNIQLKIDDFFKATLKYEDKKAYFEGEVMKTSTEDLTSDNPEIQNGKIE